MSEVLLGRLLDDDQWPDLHAERALESVQPEPDEFFDHLIDGSVPITLAIVERENKQGKSGRIRFPERPVLKSNLGNTELLLFSKFKGLWLYTEISFNPGFAKAMEDGVRVRILTALSCNALI